MHPICRCQVPGSRRWKKTMYVQRVLVSGYSLRWKRISQKFRLCLDSEQHPVRGYCGRSSSCYSMSVSASCLQVLPATAAQKCIQSQSNSLQKRCLDIVLQYYKKDVYSNLKYAQIIHRGSNDSFSLPPR